MPPLDLPPAVAARLRAATRAMAFTGAGVSRESGLATFRDAGGLWQRFRPEELASPEAFRRDPERVWSWYGERFRALAVARPNPAHVALSRLPALFPFFTLATQNVDGLHQEAGSTGVVELHGSLRRARCERCGTTMPMHEALERSPTAPPLCACGGRFRPDVVWFGEMLPEEALARATADAGACDLFIAAGTSATVYPAAGLIEIAHRAGALLVEVNPEPTSFSRLAGLRLAAPAGEALPALVEAIERCRRPTT
jgi:NAD-dependent protein deacetylase/lipoamidase